MKQILKLVLLLVFSQVAMAQAPSNYTNINGRYRWIAGMFDSTFHIPKGTSASLRTGGSTNAGALFYNTTDSTVYTYTGTQWIKLRGVIIDTTSLSNRINLKLNISDTAAMLAPYLRKVDTASLSNRINLKLNISDTATMLGNYLNNVGYGLIKVGQVVTADSATLASYFLRRKDSLTTTNPLGYVTRKILADTAAAIRSADAGGTVTSVGLTMPVAFNVANSPVTSSGTIAVTGAGLASQYIRGDGTLGDFPGGGGGGGASVSYYLNGSINQGTFGGNTYYEMNKVPILGAGTDFNIATDGYIAQFITDAGDPNLLNIPAGNWNFEMYFSASSGGGTPTFYVELYKYNGTTFTLIASNSSNPELIAFGTTITPYFMPLAVPQTSLALTDRLAIRVYVSNSGRTITLHTENNHLCQIITTFTTGITALNGLTEQVQYFTTGTTGTDFNISSSIATHTFNLPTASATNRGALSSADWTTFNNKLNISDTANMLLPYLRKVDTASLSNRINTKLNISDTSTMLGNYVNNVGYGLSKVSQVVSADSATLASYFLRRKDSLTATNLLGYVTGKILADTAAAVRAAAGTIGGSGTTNRVSKFTASGTIGNSSIADSSSSVAMTILSNGNIGINTTAPNERLEIVGTSRFTRTTSPSVHLNLSMENGFAEYDARGSIDHVWETSGTERMRLTFGGNLGVGTASPDSMLTVLEGARFQRGVRMSGLPSAPGTRALRIDANGTLSVADTTTGGGGGIGGSGTTNYLPKFTASTTLGDSRFFDNGTVTFLGNGDVNATPSTGIFSGTGGTGTNIAGAELRIRGGASTGNAAGGIISFYTSAAGSSGTGVNAATERMRIDQTNLSLSLNTIRIKNGAANTSFVRAEENASTAAFTYLTMDGRSTGFFSFSTNDLERMRITSGGSVGIGTTTIGSTLQVNGNAAIGYSASTAAPTNGLAVSGNVGINTTTIGSRLQVNGNAAIGYSASTAAPTNGLAVAGNIALNSTLSGWTSPFNVIEGNTYAGYIGFQTNVAEMKIGINNFYDGTGATGYKYKTTNGAVHLNLSGTSGFQVNTAPSGTAGTNIAAFTPVFSVNISGVTFLGNGETASSPSTGIISGTGGTGSNVAGAEFRIRGGASTGSANGGAITFYTSTAGASGTTVRAGTEKMRITSDGQITLATGANVSAIAQTGYSLTGSNASSLIDLAGTWNTTGNPTAIKLNITNTASGATADLMELQVGGVNQFIVGKSGSGYFKDMLTIAPQTANTSAIKTDGYSLTGSNAQALLSMTGTWNTTGNPTAISLDITNTASGANAYLMDLQVGGTTQFRVTKDGSFRTTAPTGGTAANWKVGTVATVTPTSPNRTIEVEIDGVIYYIHAKTTNN